MNNNLSCLYCYLAVRAIFFLSKYKQSKTVKEKVLVFLLLSVPHIPITGHCGDEMLSYRMRGAVNILTDFFILLLPLPYQARLQMETSRKVGLCRYILPRSRQGR